MSISRVERVQTLTEFPEAISRAEWLHRGGDPSRLTVGWPARATAEGGLPLNGTDTITWKHLVAASKKTVEP